MKTLEAEVYSLSFSDVGHASMKSFLILIHKSIEVHILKKNFQLQTIVISAEAEILIGNRDSSRVTNLGSHSNCENQALKIPFGFIKPD